MFETKTHCARTCCKQFGFFGQRKMKCHEYQVTRPLNSYEISIVNRNLMDRVNSLSINN